MPKRSRKKRGMGIDIRMRGNPKDWKNMKGNCCWHHHRGGVGCGYFLGFIGALIWFLQTSTGFWATILAILKAIVWPAFVVYHLLGL